MSGIFRSAAVAALGLLVGACLTPPPVLERATRGPNAEEFFVQQSYATNGPPPSFDEKRVWQDQMDEKVKKYLRDHPEIEDTSRHTEFSFWRQGGARRTPRR